MRQGWKQLLQKTRKLLVGQELGAGWESEAVGTKQQWEAKLTTAIAKREEKLWKEEVEIVMKMHR